MFAIKATKGSGKKEHGFIFAVFFLGNCKEIELEKSRLISTKHLGYSNSHFLLFSSFASCA